MYYGLSILPQRRTRAAPRTIQAKYFLIPPRLHHVYPLQAIHRSFAHRSVIGSVLLSFAP